MSQYNVERITKTIYREHPLTGKRAPFDYDVLNVLMPDGEVLESFSAKDMPLEEAERKAIDLAHKWNAHLLPKALDDAELLRQQLAEEQAKNARLGELLKRVYDLPQIKDIAISILIEDALGINDPENSPKFAEHFKALQAAPSESVEAPKLD